MLKNPRYSSAHPSKNGLPANSSKLHMFSRDIRAENQRTQPQAKKEDTLAEAALAGAICDDLPTSQGPIADEHHSLLPSKARSSLAASLYHASGYLPQYDGVGKAHTSTIHQQNGNQYSHRQARVNLPSSSSYEYSSVPLSHRIQDVDSVVTPSDRKKLSRSFGLDGFNGSPSKKKGSVSKTDTKRPHAAKEAFDTMGVTPADFNEQRPDHKNAWHIGQVNDLFEEIAEQEAEYMKVRKRQNTKTT